MSIDWTEVAALSSLFYSVAFILSILVILLQLRRQENEGFVSGTDSLFQVWADDDFQRALQWILNDLQATTWKAFMAEHRGQYGERAFVRVGSYFNRVGYLVARRLLGRYDRILLDTIAGPAIEVWERIGPLVLEARLVQNSTMFTDFERMLPDCYACYVPDLGVPEQVREGAAEAARLAEAEDRALARQEK
jgi:hypothetical protein